MKTDMQDTSLQAYREIQPHPKCYGKRKKAYKKCDSCEHITNCSAETLMRVLTKDGYKVLTSQYGELVHVDSQAQRGGM
jgi:hypothetical protein